MPQPKKKSRTLFVILGLLPIIESVSRTFFHTGVPSSADYVRYIVLWLAFLGGTIGFRQIHSVIAGSLEGVRPQPDGSVNVDGSVPIRDLNRVMDWHLPDNEATTIAGLVIHEARSIPEVGQSFTFHGFRFRVLRRERNRITALRIQPLPRKPAVGKKRQSA